MTLQLDSKQHIIEVDQQGNRSAIIISLHPAITEDIER